MSAPACRWCGMPGLDQTTSCRTSMTHSPNITSHPKIERLPEGRLAGFCCDEGNCPECLRAYREARQERAARVGQVVPRKPRKPTLTSVARAASKAAIPVARFIVD